MKVTLNPPLVNEILSLTNLDKLKIVNLILENLDEPDPKIEKVWAAEAQKRLSAMRGGKMRLYSHSEVMRKYRK